MVLSTTSMSAVELGTKWFRKFSRTRYFKFKVKRVFGGRKTGPQAHKTETPRSRGLEAFRFRNSVELLARGSFLGELLPILLDHFFLFLRACSPGLVAES